MKITIPLMPNSRDIFDKVESSEFRVQAGLASGRRMLHNIITETPEFFALLNLDPRVILIRVLDLSREPVDIEYVNPHDTAIATYLLAINYIVARSAPNLFWSRPWNE